MRAFWSTWHLGAWGIVIALLTATAVIAADQRTYRLDVYALQINGETQMVSGLEGGFVDGTVVMESTGLMPKKHLGAPTVEPVRARIRPDQFTQFLSDSLEGKADSSTGTVYYIDNAGQVQQQRALANLTLSELAFPGLSGSARPAASLGLTMTLAVEKVKADEPLAGALPPVTVDNSPQARAKRWAGDWSLQVPGLPTNRVTSIEAFSLRRKFAPAKDDRLGQTMQPGQWQVPNLVFYMPAQDSLAWIAWHDDFVVKANNSDDHEKTLTLNLLAPDLKTTLLQLQGTGVGIVSAKYEQSVTANAPTTSGFRVELYVETMKIIGGSLAVGPTAVTASSQPTSPPSTTPPKRVPTPSANRVPSR